MAVVCGGAKSCVEQVQSAMSDQSRSDARRTYQRVVRIVRFNGGALLADHHIRVVAGNAGLDADAINDALRAAVENDDLLRVYRDGTPHYAPVDEQSLLRVIETETERDHPDRGLIARCNHKLHQLRS